MKRLLLSSLAALVCTVGSAQFNYTFKDTTTAYTPLTSGTSLNGSNIWFGNNYVAPMPFTWTMDGSIPVTGFPLALDIAGVFSDTGNYSDLNGFLIGEMQIVDRGIIGTTSLSPIRYLTTGTSPNRIFKMELANAGFVEEFYSYNTLDDSFNIQIWIYETSNIVELHYGPSRVSHPTDYFGAGGTGPLTAYMKHADFDNGTTGTLFYIKGSPGATGIDSILITAPNPPTNILSAWPVSGKVFRFTPGRCNTPLSSFTAGTPAGNTVRYTYTGTTTGIDSLVWTFGDGQKLKVTSGYTTPVTHTFAANGKYNVSVTAYNTCGNTTSATKQTSLAVGGLAGLGGVKVYPNPATEVLTIEGMSAGATATVRSVVGQVVLQSVLQGGKEVLSITALPAGAYTILLTDKDGTSGTMQFTKQ